mmetsp:Transcript_50771/g.147885  ORF Transcript_50771/g.147885 Transcript_50771/m.147885 type:complete len:249 (+) Transcript_50771:783-1529(+)
MRVSTLLLRNSCTSSGQAALAFMEARAAAAAQAGILIMLGCLTCKPATQSGTCVLSSSTSRNKAATAVPCASAAAGPIAPKANAAAARAPGLELPKIFAAWGAIGNALSLRLAKSCTAPWRTLASPSPNNRHTGSAWASAKSSYLAKYNAAAARTSAVESARRLATSAALFLPSAPTKVSAVMAPRTTAGEASDKHLTMPGTSSTKAMLPTATTAAALTLALPSDINFATSPPTRAAALPIIPNAPAA